MAKQIRAKRNALGLSHTEFGKLLGVSRETVNLWENGKLTPSKCVQPKPVAEAGGFSPALESY